MISLRGLQPDQLRVYIKHISILKIQENDFGNLLEHTFIANFSLHREQNDYRGLLQHHDFKCAQYFLIT